MIRTAVLATGLAGGLAVGAGAQTQSGSLPDAQVEANVLRQLATAPELSTQNVQTSTIYGTVTLTGNVHDEAMRTKAEELAARAQGVKKVVDELTLGDTPAPLPDQGQSPDPAAQNSAPAPGQVLQSDGTYVPSGDPNQPQGGAPQYGAQPNGGQPAYGNPHGYPDQQQAGQGQAQAGYPNQQPYPNQGQQPYPSQQQGYSQQQPYPNRQQAYGNMAPPPPGYGQPAPQRQPMYPNGYTQQPYSQGGPQGGQVGGQVVTVPAGSVLQVRMDRGFDANHVTAGTPFTGIVMQDIVANGAIAIPRGAAVQGTVVDAKKAGVLKGEAELGLQVSNLTLGGQQYALATDIWQREGRDKTVGTVNSALGLGALGAIVGGVAGGGAGAAIGAGVGAGAGVAGSAASPNGRVIVPPESVLTFRLAQPTTVTTVGQAELSRLNYAAGPAPRPVPPRRYAPYGPYGYYGPAY